MAKKILNIDINRVEGDLELKLEADDNHITNAWCIGTMFRGFEELMRGRAAMDSLVITPRVCGICGTAHLYSAVTALETALNCPISPNGTRIRNICLLAEEIQSDTRQSFLMYTIDFCNPAYKDTKHYDEILEKFEPFKGKIYSEVIGSTKKLLEIVAIFGGQWPHSSYMIPGGVTALPNIRNIVQSIGIVDNYIKWYESVVLGCSLERWSAVKTMNDLHEWLNEKREHKHSGMGLFIRFGRSAELHKLGIGKGNLLSYGNYFIPELWQPPFQTRHCYRPAGFYNSETKEIEPFDHLHIQEFVKYSNYIDYEGGRHPFEGETHAFFDGSKTKYSFAKAPRYNGKTAETGPLAELFMSGDSLIRDFFHHEGSNAWLRQFVRLHRPTVSLPLLKLQLEELKNNFGNLNYEKPPGEIQDGLGFGLIMAARGALGHWTKIKDGKIEKYQMITPTGWNASPRDGQDNLGHMESTLIGTTVKDMANPVEIGHIIRSHDACLVCTVHMLNTNKKLRYNV